MTLQEHLRRSLRTDGPFVLRSGAVSDWYLDARLTTMDGGGAGLVAEAVLQVLDRDVVALGGMTMGADPIAVATALVRTCRGRPLRAFSIRKEAKGHGGGGRIVGPVSPGDTIALVEDTTTTGSALVEAATVVQAAGAEVQQAIALVDRSKGRATAGLAELGIPLRAIFTPGDLGVGA